MTNAASGREFRRLHRVQKLIGRASQKCAAVPRRARIEGSKTCVSPNSRLESNKEEEEGRASSNPVSEAIPGKRHHKAHRRLGHST